MQTKYKIKTNLEIHCAYLYADGHAVIVYKKQDRLAGEIHFAELIEQWGPACHFDGRIVWHDSMLEAFKLAQRAKHITAKEASVKNGSENTQKRGLAVGSLSIVMGQHWYSNALHWSSFPDLISSGWTYQPQMSEKWEDVKGNYHWGNERVANVYSTPEPQSQPQLVNA